MRIFILISGFLLFLNQSLFSQTLEDVISLVSQERVIQNMLEFSGEVSVTIGDSEVFIQHRISSTGNDLAAEYLIEKLSRPNIIVNDISFGSKGRNILGIQLGTENPDKIYVVCAHYDSVAEHGADDNASGSIAVIETATILSQYNLKNTIIYALWDEEEVGLLGAKDYAENAQQNNDNILGVLNMDMMAYDSNNDHRFDIDVRNVANSYEIRDDLIQLYTSLNLDLNHHVVDPGTTASDHAAFWNQGYSALLLGEAWSDNDFTPGYHTNGDQWSLLNEEYYLEMIKLAIAYTAFKGELISSSLNESLKDKILISPNPAHSQVRIYYENNDIDGYLFFDQLGRLVKSGSLNVNEEIIDVSTLSNSSYFLQLKKGNKTVFQKVLIKN